MGWRRNWTSDHRRVCCRHLWRLATHSATTNPFVVSLGFVNPHITARPHPCIGRYRMGEPRHPTRSHQSSSRSARSRSTIHRPSSSTPAPSSRSSASHVMRQGVDAVNAGVVDRQFTDRPIQTQLRPVDAAWRWTRANHPRSSSFTRSILPGVLALDRTFRMPRIPSSRVVNGLRAVRGRPPVLRPARRLLLSSM